MPLFSFSSSKSTLRKSFDSPSDPPPRYSEAVESGHHCSCSSRSSDLAGFVPTATLQVQAIGYDANQAVTGSTLENIPVFRSGSRDAEYVSVRLDKNSNSCVLIRAADEATLISTIYRWGLGRHPRMRILNPHSKISIEDAIEIENENVHGEVIKVKPAKSVSHGQVFDMSLGKFEWRYGTRKEEAACNADSLLIMERFDRVALPGGGRSIKGARIAQLVRNDQYRTPGTKKCSGGNGGRLFIDLRMWNEDQHTCPQRVEAFVVASCLLMLQREANRFIDNHLAMVL